MYAYDSSSFRYLSFFKDVWFINRLLNKLASDVTNTAATHTESQTMKIKGVRGCIIFGWG